MSAFSGTNLPPIVRLDGTADALTSFVSGPWHFTAPKYASPSFNVKPAAPLSIEPKTNDRQSDQPDNSRQLEVTPVC